MQGLMPCQKSMYAAFLVFAWIVVQCGLKMCVREHEEDGEKGCSWPAEVPGRHEVPGQPAGQDARVALL